MSTEPATNAASGLLRATMQMWENAIQAGVKIQEESGRQFTQMLAQLKPSEQWSKQTQTLLAEAVQTAGRNIEEATRVVHENTKRNLDLLEKATRADAVPADAPPTPAQNVWEATLQAIQSNTQSLAQANSRVFESWVELGKRLGETMSPHSQM